MGIQLKHNPIPPRAKVGDKVYYISPNNRYGVKTAVITDIRLVPRYYEQVMSNGDVVLKDSRMIADYTTFISRDDAVRYIMAGLVEDINQHRTSIATLQHELNKCERILTTLQHLFPELEPCAPNYHFEDTSLAELLAQLNNEKESSIDI